MPQYDNPAAFMADPSTAQGIPGLQGALAAQRQSQSAPFLDMLRQQMQMETSQKGTELQEFQSPIGVAQRQAVKQKIIDEGNMFHETMQDSIKKSHEEARLRPYLTDEQIAKAKLDAQQHGHLFASAPATYFSGMMPFIEGLKKQGATDEQIAPIYNQAVKDSGFPVDKLDPEVQTWGKDTMAHLAMHRMAQVQTPEYEQKLGAIAATGEQQQAVARINVQGRLSEVNAMIRAGRFDNDQRTVASLERSIRTGIDADSGEKMDPAAIQEATKSLQRYRGAKLNDYITKQTAEARLVHMMTMIKGTPEEKKAADDELNRQVTMARTQGMQTLGIRPEDLGYSPTPHKVGDSVTVNGQSYKISTVNPDGSYSVMVNGRIRKIVPR